MILVTGATGLIGGLTTELLMKAQSPVRVMVRQPERARAFLDSGLEAVVADFDQPDSLPAAVDGVEAVLLVSPSNPDMVRQQSALVDAVAAQDSAATRIVKVSGFLTALDSTSASGRWHAEIEAKIAGHQIPMTSLRPPFFMQNLLRLAESVKNESIIRSAADQARIAMVDARDIAAVAARCLMDVEQVGKAHLVTGPRAMTHVDVASECSRVLGRTIAFEARALEAESEAHRAAGVPEWRIGVLEEFQRGFAAGEGAPVSTVVKDLTGKEPLSLGQFIDDHRAVFGAD